MRLIPDVNLAETALGNGQRTVITGLALENLGSVTAVLDNRCKLISCACIVLRNAHSTAVAFKNRAVVSIMQFFVPGLDFSQEALQIAPRVFVNPVP